MLSTGMKLPPPTETDSKIGNRIPPPPTINNDMDKMDELKPATPQISVITGLIAVGKPIGEVVEKKKQSTSELKPNLIIPAGSFVKATLLTGVITPTIGKGTNDPVPALLRITGLAQLPNYFKTDVKNCFLLAETKGNLATETVSFRLKSMACKMSNGKTIEKAVDGYITGENGIEGLTGRVVSKQGSLIARAFAAEFMGGISSAFQEAGNTVSTTAAGVVTTLDPSKTLQTGLFSGAAGAFSRVSEFYMDLADNMVPVIEIMSGRNVDAVFITPVDLAAEEHN